MTKPRCRIFTRRTNRYNPYHDRGHAAEVAHYLLDELDTVNETTCAVQEQLAYRVWHENRFYE